MPSPNEPRLAFEAPIHEMETRLSRDGSPVRQEPHRGRHDQDRRADPPAPPRAGRAEARDLFPPRPLADRPGLAARQPPPDPRLYRPDLRAVPRAARRPRLRRRQGDRHRAGASRRHQGHVHRPSEGEKPGRAQGLPFRLCPSRRLSQGPAEDAAGRQVRPADHLVHRYARGLSGHHRRGARPGRDHRREPAGHEPDPHARSSASSSARAAPAVRWASALATAWRCSSSRITRSSAPRAAPRSSGRGASTPPKPRPRSR